MKRLSSRNEMYRVNFIIDGVGRSSEFTGFQEERTKDHFEGGWTMELLYHDIFEHWFEFTDYFRTDQLSQSGECVAMGIRQYIYEESNIVEDYALGNSYRGVTGNLAAVMIGQILETQNEDDEKYPNDFDFKSIDAWDGINRYRGYFEGQEFYDQLTDKNIEGMERAFSYGYFLGEHLFQGKFEFIDKFCRNLKMFLSTAIKEQLDGDEYFHNAPHLDGKTLKVSVRKNEVVALYDYDYFITSNQSENKVEEVCNRVLYGDEYYA